MAKFELPKELVVTIANHEVEFISNISMEILYEIISWIDSGRVDMFKHENIKYIDEGSYSEVFKCHDKYAIKMLLNENNSENKDIQALKDLKHLDCIPTIYAVIDRKYIIIDFVDGITVRRYCEESRNNPYNLEKEKTLNYWEDALCSIVLEGYTPDDLHTSNVMIEKATGELKIVDVGWFYKHRKQYDKEDLERIRNNYGYSRADRWTGRELRGFFDRLERVKEIEKRDAKLEEKRYAHC